MNEKGTMDEMDCNAMVQEEVHDQQNDSEELDICLIDISLCY